MKRLIGVSVVCMLIGTLAWAESPQDGDFNAPGSEAGMPAGQAEMGPPPNAMFSVIDVNGDGTITKNELRKAVAALKKLDMDGDGQITLAEVSPQAGTAMQGESAQFVDRMLANDRNGDGRLTRNEVDSQMAMMLDGADVNNDGAIDRQELTAAAENMRNRGAGGFSGQFGATEVNTGNLMSNDRNGDGRLTPDELPVQMHGTVRGADQNKDGAIDAKELQLMNMRMQMKHGRGPGGKPNFPGRNFGQGQQNQ